MFLSKASLLTLTLFFSLAASAQMVTGVWKGRVNGRKAEVKLVQKGDSLVGTSYYETLSGSRRYTVRGYLHPDGSVIWWDDQLIASKGTAGKSQQLSVADYNCPGGGEMYLNGKSGPVEDRDEIKGSVSLTKVPGTEHPDEWDFVIDNFTVGASDPDIIDSVTLIASRPQARPEPRPAEPRPRQPEVFAKLPARKPGMASIPPPPQPKAKTELPQPQPPALTVEQKFTTRKKEVSIEIPVYGDSVEFRFYDNAEVDGDSISLFLNNRLLFTHVRLTDRAYTIKLPVAELGESSELVMVAENLGSIPPNTSYMVAIVGNERHTAQLASTENSSAAIRLRKAR